MHKVEFAEVLIQRAHPLFAQTGSFSHDYLLDEIEAAGDMPLSAYFAQPREDRIAKVSAYILRRAMQAISEFDAHEKAKKK